MAQCPYCRNCALVQERDRLRGYVEDQMCFCDPDDDYRCPRCRALTEEGGE